VKIEENKPLLFPRNRPTCLFCSSEKFYMITHQYTPIKTKKQREKENESIPSCEKSDLTFLLYLILGSKIPTVQSALNLIFVRLESSEQKFSNH
jgi:hypothetical protein